MTLRLRNLLAIPALFLGINDEPEKAYSQKPTTPIKREVKQEPKVNKETSLDMLNFDANRLFQNESNKRGEYVSAIDNSSFKITHTPSLSNNNNSLQTISFVGIGIIAVIVLATLYKKNKDELPTNEEIKDALKKAFPEQDEELEDFENYITLENIFASDSISPEERINLIVILRMLSNSSKWNDFIKTERANLQFEKKKQILETLPKDNSVLLEFQQAIYPSWKFGDLKLESFTFVEDTYNLGREAKSFTLVLNDYINPVNLLTSILCELNRISIQQNNGENKIPLTRLQAESLDGELNDLWEINQTLTKNPLYKKICVVIEQKIQEDIDQYNKWRAAYFRYLAEVSSQPLTPSMDHFFK